VAVQVGTDLATGLAERPDWNAFTLSEQQYDGALIARVGSRLS
jgi:hypothetical protein